MDREHGAVADGVIAVNLLSLLFIMTQRRDSGSGVMIFCSQLVIIWAHLKWPDNR